MYSRIPCVAGLCLSLLASNFSAAHGAPTWSLRIDSSPGAFIGEGQSYLFLNRTEPINALAFSHSQSNGPDGIEFFHSIDTVSPTFLIRLVTQKLVQALAVGEYANAQRAFFEQADVPGFEFDFAGRGANTLTARFTVHEIAYHFLSKEVSYTLFQLDKISFTFTELGDGSIHPVSGAFAFNTSLPEQIAEPSSMTIFLSGLLCIGCVLLIQTIKIGLRGLSGGISRIDTRLQI